MATASVLVLGSVPAMAEQTETKTAVPVRKQKLPKRRIPDRSQGRYVLEDGIYTAEFDTDS